MPYRYIGGQGDGGSDFSRLVVRESAPGLGECFLTGKVPVKRTDGSAAGILEIGTAMDAVYYHGRSLFIKGALYALITVFIIAALVIVFYCLYRPHIVDDSGR